VTSEKAVTVLVSVMIVVLVAVVQERSRHLAAIIATMPLTAPLAMWIVFSASRGDQRQTGDFVESMIVGSVASLAFVLACWLGFRQAWVPGNPGVRRGHLAPDRAGFAPGRALDAVTTGTDVTDHPLTDEIRGFFQTYNTTFASMDGGRIAALYSAPTITMRAR
jgi:hypothetical protein